MTDWQDLEREYGEHDLATGEYVVKRRQRRPIFNEKGEVVDWEFRWKRVGPLA